MTAPDLVSLERSLAVAPLFDGAVEADSLTLRNYVRRGEELLATLPPKPERDPDQQRVATAVHEGCRSARHRFMAAHATAVYGHLCQAIGDRPRLAVLASRAAEMFPGLVPGREQLALERLRPQKHKEGREIDQGIFFSEVLRVPAAGLHLLESMLRPTAPAAALLPEFSLRGAIELPTLRIERRGPVAHLTVCNTACLNAEDDHLIDDMETAVDLVLLDNQVRVCVLRGGEMTHPKYAGRRVFSAGLNLRDLQRGRISYVDFLLRRELGYISKILRGLVTDDRSAMRRPQSVVKPWIAAVDTFAIGGGAQLLLVFDHVIAATDSYFCLPAAQEGIVPGAANLRLGRAVGPRLLRQVILSGRKVLARDPEASLLFDEIVEPAAMDSAIELRAAQLAGAAVVANKRMIALAEEPLDLFRAYMAEFALEQAIRLYSPDVLEKVER